MMIDENPKTAQYIAMELLSKSGVKPNELTAITRLMRAMPSVMLAADLEMADSGMVTSYALMAIATTMTQIERTLAQMDHDLGRIETQLSAINFHE